MRQIQHALRLLLAKGDVQLLATSFMYESPAAYVTDQPAFTNAACKVSPKPQTLNPQPLSKPAFTNAACMVSHLRPPPFNLVLGQLTT